VIKRHVRPLPDFSLLVFFKLYCLQKMGLPFSDMGWSKFTHRIGSTLGAFCFVVTISSCTEVSPVGEWERESGGGGLAQENASIREYEVAKTDKIAMELARDCSGQVQVAFEGLDEGGLLKLEFDAKSNCNIISRRTSLYFQRLSQFGLVVNIYGAAPVENYVKACEQKLGLWDKASLRRGVEFEKIFDSCPVEGHPQVAEIRRKAISADTDGHFEWLTIDTSSVVFGMGESPFDLAPVYLHQPFEGASELLCVASGASSELLAFPTVIDCLGASL